MTTNTIYTSNIITKNEEDLLEKDENYNHDFKLFRETDKITKKSNLYKTYEGCKFITISTTPDVQSAEYKKFILSEIEKWLRLVIININNMFTPQAREIRGKLLYHVECCLFYLRTGVIPEDIHAFETKTANEYLAYLQLPSTFNKNERNISIEGHGQRLWNLATALSVGVYFYGNVALKDNIFKILSNLDLLLLCGVCINHFKMHDFKNKLILFYYHDDDPLSCIYIMHNKVNKMLKKKFIDFNFEYSHYPLSLFLDKYMLQFNNISQKVFTAKVYIPNLL